MSLQNRPPVITIMGHVDHGKTTLLDFIRKSKVTAGEAGGITQHIGAYTVDYKGKPLTFIDTPGHAAFNKMRERGAQVTDIVILIVAVDDGVKPQTIESIRHIKNSKVSVIVAINKCDKKDVYPDMVKGQLAEHDIKVQGLGGEIEAIEISAETGKGVDKLLETLVAMAEMENYQADPEAPLQAVVIESSKDDKQGPKASVLVQQGTLAPRQEIFVENKNNSEKITGRVRALIDDRGKRLEEVKPGYAVEILGLKAVPGVGSIINEEGREYTQINSPAEEATENDDSDTIENQEDLMLAQEDELDFSDFDVAGAFGETKPKLKLIVKADVEGTLEAIEQNLDPDSVELIASGVGQVNDSDLEMAQTTGSNIIAFHIKTSNRIKEQAKTMGVKLKVYDIIYKLIEDLQKQMLKLMEPTIDEVFTGEAEILQIFEMKGERIAGVRVKTGEIKKADLLHLKRDEEIIADPVMKSMRHGKDEVLVIKTKGEGGLIFKKKKLDFQVGDIIVAYKVEED